MNYTMIKPPSVKEGDNGSFHFSFMTSAVVVRILKTWLLLGSESTPDVFNNPDLLMGIHTVRIPVQTT